MSHPQFRDEKFREALEALPYAAKGPWVLALPRADIDPVSKLTLDFGSEAAYTINAKVNVVAMMHVLSHGPGRVRLGWREHIPVDVGDLVLVNLREAGHWITLHGRTYYLFTGDVPFARVFRTSKSADPPLLMPGEPDAEYAKRRMAWNDEWFWNIQDVLSDYVLLGRDPQAEREMMNGPDTLIHLTKQSGSDGHRSDNARDNRFPIVYRRVMGVGPGKWLTRESDLGIVEREETKSEARPGHMMAMCKTVAAAAFHFQGCPLEAIHAASVLVGESSQAHYTYRSDGSMKAEVLEVDIHESVPQPLTWVDPDDTAVDEDPDAVGEAVA